MAQKLFAERLRRTVSKYGPLCVGIDPTFDKLPKELKEKAKTPTEEAAAIGIFTDSVIEAVKGVAGVLKFQVAYFERYGAAGFVELESAVKRAKNDGFMVIADGKRGDIGSTMKAYAKYYMDVLDADAVTLNPYMGKDVIEPFLPYVDKGKGAFLLARTSNPAAAETQDVSASAGHAYYIYLTDRIASWQEKIEKDKAGYLPFGIVVGATVPEEIKKLRAKHPELLMLIPGFGFQGGTADDAAPAFDAQGNGAVVNSSRSVICAFQQEGGETAEAKEDPAWQGAIRDAAKTAQGALKEAIARRKR